MKINSHTRIEGRQVILVPYRESHVPKLTFPYIFQVFNYLKMFFFQQQVPRMDEIERIAGANRLRTVDTS